jgi:hypothetical protein
MECGCARGYIDIRAMAKSFEPLASEDGEGTRRMRGVHLAIL